MQRDLFSVGQHNYLIVVDYYSKFPFVKEVNGKVTSCAVIDWVCQRHSLVITAANTAVVSSDDLQSSGNSTM